MAIYTWIPHRTQSWGSWHIPHDIGSNNGRIIPLWSSFCFQQRPKLNIVLCYVKQHLYLRDHFYQVHFLLHRNSIQSSHILSVDYRISWEKDKILASLDSEVPLQSKRMFNGLLLILSLTSIVNAQDDYGPVDSFCKKSPNWWDCSMGFAIMNPTVLKVDIRPTEVKGMLYDHNCKILDQQSIIGDIALLQDINDQGFSTTLHGSDLQADWNMTVRMAQPTAVELLCSNIVNFPSVSKPPPEYPFSGCSSLMPLGGDCNTDVYDKHIDQPFGSMTTAACGLQPGIVRIDATDRWGNNAEPIWSRLAVGRGSDGLDICECTTEGGCVLGKKGGFCCRCPVKCKSSYFN